MEELKKVTAIKGENSCCQGRILPEVFYPKNFKNWGESYRSGGLQDRHGTTQGH